MEEKTLINRKKLFKNIRRIVIKAGSGILTGKDGLNNVVINSLTSDICNLRSKGFEVILVSSGAIAAGMKKMGYEKRPDGISEKQAMAAIGQGRLMMAYEKAFGCHGVTVAQILITRDDLNNRRRYLNARNTVLTLLSWGVVPIINENDTVVIDEIKFGDNDNLSAMVANMTGSNLLTLLTDIDGLYDDDPRSNNNARLIPLIKKIAGSHLQYANSVPGALGTGGMASKITAARKATLKGIPVIIANGYTKNIIRKVMKGEEVGTLFLPQTKTICGRKHWIAFTRAIKGEIIIDDGAVKALIKNGKSLLPSGVIGLSGKFNRGDSVQIVDRNGNEIAAGMVDYSYSELEKIKGLNSQKIEDMLGFKHNDEIIHRDNLLITNGQDGDEICQ
ncbi:MAG: glutamate 5-kinase [Deltaproteobacteria bacterium]|jgi:glutamate 5-kinase|nr:glutamate 5-kinase [Deltaproteobacteria bacterium]